MPDNSVVGSFTLLPMFNSGVAIGTPEYYFSAGMSRASFGPFDENNIIIGEQAFHAGQFIFVINKDKFTYNQIFLLYRHQTISERLFSQQIYCRTFA